MQIIKEVIANQRYESEDKTLVLARNALMGDKWVLKKNGLILAVDKFRNDIADEFNLQLQDIKNY